MPTSTLAPSSTPGASPTASSPTASSSIAPAPIAPPPPRRRRGRRSAVLAAGALAVVGSLVATAAPAGAQTAPFGTFPAVTHTAAGTGGHILVGGDSLTSQAMGTGNGLAAAMSSVTGRPSLVSAAGGATWKTYYDANQTAGNWTLPAWAFIARPSVTVTALGSNDAKLLALKVPQYTGDIARQTAMTGLRDQMQWSRCALLINTYTNSGSAFFPPAETNFINLGLLRVAADMNTELRAQRVFVADWNGFAKPFHAQFYPGGDIHLTPTGAAWYQAFIVSKTKELLALPQCR